MQQPIQSNGVQDTTVDMQARLFQNSGVQFERRIVGQQTWLSVNCQSRNIIIFVYDNLGKFLYFNVLPTVDVWDWGTQQD